MQRWKIIAGLLVIFLSGCIVGSTATGLYVRQFIRTKVDALVSGDTDTAVELVMKRLTRTLTLTDQQQAAITPIIQQAAQRIRAIRIKLRPEFMEVFIDTAAQIKTHLNPDQQKEIELLMQRIKNGLTDESVVTD